MARKFPLSLEPWVTEGFFALGLSRETMSAIAQANIGVPTPLQVKLIPPALLGRDIVAVSAPGSGRTTAFLLALIERLGNLSGTRALVLARTRARIQEIHEHFDALAVGRPFKVTEILHTGGLAAQESELRERRHLLLAEPQRLTEHMDKGAVNFSNIEMVVLDAADDLVADGLLQQLKRIVTRLPPRRQTLIFTRSLIEPLAIFARTHLRDPILIEVASTEAAAAHEAKRPEKIEAPKVARPAAKSARKHASAPSKPKPKPKIAKKPIRPAAKKKVGKKR